MSVRACLLLTALLTGCFGGAATPRYFHPVLRADRDAAAVSSGATPLRLRAVTAASYLDERIVWRRSEAEVGYYGDERWTESPAAYVERALGRELFERRGLRRSANSQTPYTLELVVRRFEEVLLPGHLARVELGVWLVDAQRDAVLERTVRVERPVGEERAEALAGAMGQALEDAVEQVADAVERTLTAQGS